jgi:hypothetical protein
MRAPLTAALLLVPLTTSAAAVDGTRAFAPALGSALRLVAEGGYQAGRNQHLPTQFEKLDTSRGMLFAGLGLRLGL